MNMRYECVSLLTTNTITRSSSSSSTCTSTKNKSNRQRQRQRATKSKSTCSSNLPMIPLPLFSSSSFFSINVLLVMLVLLVLLLHPPPSEASPPFVIPAESELRASASTNINTSAATSNNKNGKNINPIITSSILSRSTSAGASSSKTATGSSSSTSSSSSSSSTTKSTTSSSSSPSQLLDPIVSSSQSRSNTVTTTRPIRVCYQGEPGAYSEKSLRQLLGPNVIAVARPNFESCYRAVASRECDYACLPFENSLGGSIHDNYDLMLRYDLTIVAEHEFRVKHCLLALDGVERDDIMYCMSHPQALAQCDNYLRGLGITPVPMYDTAGSAKLLQEAAARAAAPQSKKGGNKDKDINKDKDKDSPERALPDKCTPQNTAAIASDLAGDAYGLNCLDSGIEDDDTNFTRFLLLGRSGVSHYLNYKHTPSKTSIVFTLPNTPGALYKALACFSLRDIDFSKIESRPTSASLLNYLKFKNRAEGKKSRNQADLPRFRYCFYLDFLACELDENAQNALHHLKEQAEFCRILGSYPQKSKLVGPVYEQVEASKKFEVTRDDVTVTNLPSDDDDGVDGGLTLNVGIIGYGAFGQFLGKKFSEHHKVRCIDHLDKSIEAEETGAEYYPTFEMNTFLKESDVLILAIPLVDFESVVSSLPSSLLHKKLIIDVCPLSTYTKSTLLQHLPTDTDIICSNPMFGPSSASADKSWDGQPFIFDKVRIADERRSAAFLKVFERSRCQMVQMTSEQQDDHTADAEFVTHLAGRLLGYGKVLPPTPVPSKEYAALCDVTDMTKNDSFDLFYGMYKFNPNAKSHIAKIRENLAKVEQKLAAKEAYLVAREELRNSDRQRLISECKQLLKEVAQNSRSDVAREKEGSEK